MFCFARLLFEINVLGCDDQFALYKIRDCFVDRFSEVSNNISNKNAFKDVFGQTLSTDPTALRRFQKPPLPFAFHIPVLPKNKMKSKTSISLSIAGTALNHVPIFISAVKNALNSIAVSQSFQLDISGCYSVVSPEGLSELSPSGEGLTILLPSEIHGGCNNMSLEICSPLRIIRGGKLVRNYAFSDFVRPLLRRISSLAYYYGGVELNLDFRWLSDISEQVESLNINLYVDKFPVIGAGVMGYIDFKEVPPEFHPFLVMGEQFNLGKCATYGGGGYRISGAGINK
jgi:hypothetical protein